MDTKPLTPQPLALLVWSHGKVYVLLELMLPCLAFQLLVRTFGMHIYKLRVQRSTTSSAALSLELRMKAALESFAVHFMAARLRVETSGTTSVIAWDI